MVLRYGDVVGVPPMVGFEPGSAVRPPSVFSVDWLGWVVVVAVVDGSVLTDAAEGSAGCVCGAFGVFAPMPGDAIDCGVLVTNGVAVVVDEPGGCAVDADGGSGAIVVAEGDGAIVDADGSGAIDDDGSGAIDDGGSTELPGAVTPVAPMPPIVPAPPADIAAPGAAPPAVLT